MSVPSGHRWVFWDVDPDQIDVERDRDYIIPRVLEHGGIAEVRWLIRTVGLNEIHRFLRDVGHPDIGARTLQFWKAFFDAGGEEWARSSAWRTTSGGPWID